MKSTQDFVSFKNVSCIRKSTEAILCVGPTGKERWIPLFGLHENSSVRAINDVGTLVLKRQWAEENGLVPSSASTATEEIRRLTEECQRLQSMCEDLRVALEESRAINLKILSRKPRSRKTDPDTSGEAGEDAKTENELASEW